MPVPGKVRPLASRLCPSTPAHPKVGYGGYPNEEHLGQLATGGSLAPSALSSTVAPSTAD